MSLSADLLEQAEALRQVDVRRPKQASLRRAASTAYYALFHEICAASAKLSLPGGATRELHEAFQRTHGHSTMAKACGEVAAALEKQLAIAEGRGGSLSQNQRKIQSLFGGSIPPLLMLPCRGFVSLHTLRERADYSATSSFTREQIFYAILAARMAIAALHELAAADAAALYLLLRTRDLRLG